MKEMQITTTRTVRTAVEDALSFRLNLIFVVDGIIFVAGLLLSISGRFHILKTGRLLDCHCQWFLDGLRVVLAQYKNLLETGNFSFTLPWESLFCDFLTELHVMHFNTSQDLHNTRK